MAKTNPLKNFVATIPQNIFAGFVVSLVALPLALGLAIASDAPPIAGIISSIVGGILVAILGGGNLSITGPGNGLVIIILSSITLLGEGNLAEGYLFTLAAIICSGVLLFLFGVFRWGGLSEFFPTSAIQGMLAAIGIGILAKQFHVMLGVDDIKGSTLSLLYHIPDSIIFVFSNLDFSSFIAAGVGLISLSLLLFHSKIKISWIRKIPAPLMVIIFAIGTDYAFQLFATSGNPIKESLLIQFPESLFETFPRPNFSKAFSSDFIKIVVSITLIAGIETLLSIKAIDKLDPQKRRTNVNKDLRAVGIANVVSGFLGGLNVVTVIARSSVNVNNNATNRSSNLFHALFLVLFIFIFQSQIERIALPALASILVYTGFKLASPSNFLKILKIGKEQALIFLLTLIFTLTNGLIFGIFIGLVATLVSHFFITKSITLFSRNIFKPNVLMFKEDETGQYYLSVKNFCNFLNYFKLKEKLDEISEKETIVVDFSFCDFVDHTVMEDLNDYRRSFSKNGGKFDVVGLDIHDTSTQHPFAIRKVLPNKIFANSNKNLTKRQENLKEFTELNDWDYVPETTNEDNELIKFSYFSTKVVNYVFNQLINTNGTEKVFDASYSEGSFIVKDDLKATFLLLKTPYPLPYFILDKENFLKYHFEKEGFKTIHFKNNASFSKKFLVLAKKRTHVEHLFTQKLIEFFEENKTYFIEANPYGILIKHRNRISSIVEIEEQIVFGEKLLDILFEEY